MLTFRTLKYKNFLSVGDNEILIDFTKTKSTLIVGHNGSGKSLMLDALSFALFGKPHRPINKPQLVNSINNKKCVVEVEFGIGKKDYKIIRGLKPAIFEIWCDGTMINQDSHTRDYQKLFETNILKLNHKSFHQVVVLGSSNFTPFMQLPAWTRRTVIEDLLDISIFSKMNVGLKEAQSKLKEEIKDTEYKIKVALEKISMQNKHIDKLKLISKDNEDALDAAIKELQEETDTLIESTETLTQKYQEEYAIAQGANNKESSKLKKLERFESQINDNIKNLTNESSFYDKEQESFFKQEKAEHSLYVISKGSVRTNIQSTKFILNFTQMNYVEMAKLVPFEDYLEYGQRNVDLINDTLNYAVSEIKNSGERFNYEIYVEECESLGHKLNYTEILTPGEFEAFKKMAFNTLNKYGERHLHDLHSGNFAITPNTIGDDEPTFVLFDP